MCFSAGASFGASAVLAVVGIISVRKAKLPSQIAFATIPFIFSFQQLAEGMVWLSLTHEQCSFLEPFGTYLFLIIAQIVWPTWVPLSILLLEKDKKRKKILSAILGLGIVLSVYLSFCYIMYSVKAEISHNHIEYHLKFPHTKNLLWLSALIYFIPTVLSTLVSSVKKMKLLGIVILLSCVITRLITLTYFISIWCFFAALISVLVLKIMIELKQSTTESNDLAIPN